MNAVAAPAVSTRPRVIVLEFNELSPTLMREFMAQGVLPNFSRLHGDAQAYVTDAEEAAPNLEPWIQWVTAHSGQSYRDHGVYHLGDGHKLKTKQVWDLLSDHGLKVWVCGSMNLRYDRPINGAVLPDPWAAGTDPFPGDLFDAYFPFVQRNVQEYTNTRVPLSHSDYLRFVSFMAAHGLSLKTASAIARQLGGERLTRKGKWRRATILDRLQFDVFRWYYQKERPDFSTFFVNSTAHLQHMHWRNMDPAPFKLKPGDDEQREYQHAIRYGYQMMDQIVGQTLEMAGPDVTVVMMSALSQQPCLRYEDSGGKTFYRPREFERVLEYAGVPRPYRVEPVMSEQFHVHFDSEPAALAAATALRGLRLEGQPAMEVKHDGASVFAGCSVFRQLDRDVPLARPGGEPRPFFELFYQVEGLKSGMHHPDGILWIRDPARPHREHPDKVPLRDVAPTMLAAFGVTPPGYMTGTSLL
ncbi:hypothetical protein ACFQZQ_01170 [Lysobacter koreensis]|uniref:Uncharacterized protein n=1 Tax=Lysobacter koreensis TaxID=266122 RepID=A0ABW2YM49_9GAMM